MKKVKDSTLRKFLESGGYDIIESKNPPGWVNPKTGRVWWRLFSSLKEKTGLSRPTCMNIQRHFPTREDAENHLKIKPKIITIKDYSEGSWISKEDCKLLKEAYYNSEEARKKLRRAIEYAKRYILIDAVKYETAKHFIGEIKFDEYIKGEIRLSEQKQNILENQLEELERELYKLRSNLHFLNIKIK